LVLKIGRKKNMVLEVWFRSTIPYLEFGIDGVKSISTPTTLKP
jgi:hypothetical protein